MTRARRVVAGMLLAGGLLAGGAGVAAAAPHTPAVHAPAVDIPTGTDCLRPPDPGHPNDMPGGLLDTTPDSTAAPATGSGEAAFAANLYHTYGYSNAFNPPIYDPGCLSTKKITDGPQLLMTWQNQVTMTIIAADTTVTRWTMTTDWGPLFAPVTKVLSEQFGLRVLTILGGFAVALTGLYMLGRGLFTRDHEENPGQVVRSHARTFAILAIGVGCAVWAGTIGTAFDRTLTTTWSAANSLAAHGNPSAADATAQSAFENVLWPTWKWETFGNNPAAATEFGPRLFAASAFTRAEQAQIDAHPDQAPAMIDAKKEAYKTAAEELKGKYPAAYEVLAGNDTTMRPIMAAMGLVGVVVALIPCVLALGWAAVAKTAARVVVAAYPIIALVTQFPLLQGHAFKVINAMWRIFLTAIALTFVSVIWLVGVVGGVMGAPVVLPVKLLLVSAMLYAARWMWKRRDRLYQATRVKENMAAADRIVEAIRKQGSSWVAQGRAAAQAAEGNYPAAVVTLARDVQNRHTTTDTTAPTTAAAETAGQAAREAFAIAATAYEHQPTEPAPRRRTEEEIGTRVLYVPDAVYDKDGTLVYQNDRDGNRVVASGSRELAREGDQ